MAAIFWLELDVWVHSCTLLGDGTAGQCKLLVYYSPVDHPTTQLCDLYCENDDAPEFYTNLDFIAQDALLTSLSALDPTSAPVRIWSSTIAISWFRVPTRTLDHPIHRSSIIIPTNDVRPIRREENDALLPNVYPVLGTREI